MRKFIGAWVCSLVLVTVLAGGAVLAAEKKIPLEKVPKAAIKTVKTRFKGAKLVGAAKEVEEGKTVYEVMIKYKNHNIDVSLTSSGKIIEFEREITAKDLPKAVSAALEAKYPKATYSKIEEVVKVKSGKEKLENYEVQLETSDKKEFEVLVGPSGKLTKETAKKKKG